MRTVAQLLANKPSQMVHVVSAEATVLEALRLLADYNLGALPVVDANQCLVGLFSERDYARKGVLQGRSSIGTRVRELMTQPVITVHPRQGLRDCMALMTERHLRHLPVLQGERLVGLLSIGDLVRETLAEQDGLIHSLEQYIRGAA